MLRHDGGALLSGNTYPLTWAGYIWIRPELGFIVKAKGQHFAEFPDTYALGGSPTYPDGSPLPTTPHVLPSWPDLAYELVQYYTP